MRPEPTTKRMRNFAMINSRLMPRLADRAGARPTCLRARRRARSRPAPRFLKAPMSVPARPTNGSIPETGIRHAPERHSDESRHRQQRHQQRRASAHGEPDRPSASCRPVPWGNSRSLEWDSHPHRHLARLFTGTATGRAGRTYWPGRCAQPVTGDGNSAASQSVTN